MGGMHGGGHAWQGAMHGRGCAWQGVCVVGHAWQGGCMAGGALMAVVEVSCMARMPLLADTMRYGQ